MSDDKRETKEALLGELESIKDLLSEDEWGDIPVLNDALATPDTAQPSPLDSDPPLLTSYASTTPAKDITTQEDIATQENVPTLNDANPHISAKASSDIDAAVDKLNFDLSLELDLDEQTDDEPAAKRDEATHNLDTRLTPKPTEPNDHQPPSVTNTIETQHNPTEPAATEHNANKPTDNTKDTAQGLEQKTREQDSKQREQAEDAQEQALEQHIDELTHQLEQQPAETTLSEFANIRTETHLSLDLALPEDSGSAELTNDTAAHNDTQNSPLEARLSEQVLTPLAPQATDEYGNPLPEGVLPGQQSLFELEAHKNDGKSARDFVRTSSRPTVKATGENPFLPKHIRDRLHTGKALIDIIKETPMPTEASRHLTEQVQDNLQHHPTADISRERIQRIVEDVIALYMPRIEVELRERLLMEANKNRHPSEAQD